MTDIIITVRPAAGKAGQQFDAHADGRYLCTSTSPFTAACRILIAQGADPDAVAIMRHAGSNDDALRGRLGAVAAPTAQATPPRRRTAKPNPSRRRRADLRWEGTHLYAGRKLVASIVRDADNAFMWRVRQPDGTLSDQVNLTRAKDAAEAMARADLPSPESNLSRGSVRSIAPAHAVVAGLSAKSLQGVSKPIVGGAP